MDETAEQNRSSDEPARAAEEPRAEAAAQAVARMLANPRRTRRA
ncbi:hypothetical protein [Blastococcus sp. TBT05-19]|nr:hypothetical protein [Blastococcus sp. TBT05-19]